VHFTDLHANNEGSKDVFVMHPIKMFRVQTLA
jgi:hypothetical protein